MHIVAIACLIPYQLFPIKFSLKFVVIKYLFIRRPECELGVEWSSKKVVHVFIYLLKIIVC